jgi:hypothetical protein
MLENKKKWFVRDDRSGLTKPRLVFGMPQEWEEQKLILSTASQTERLSYGQLPLCDRSEVV